MEDENKALEGLLDNLIENCQKSSVKPGELCLELSKMMPVLVLNATETKENFEKFFQLLLQEQIRLANIIRSNYDEARENLMLKQKEFLKEKYGLDGSVQ